MECLRESELGEYGNVPGSGTKYNVTEKVVTVFSHRNFALVEFVDRIAQKLARGYLVRQKLRKQTQASLQCFAALLCLISLLILPAKLDISGYIGLKSGGLLSAYMTQ